MSIDFASLASELLARAESLLPEWLPGGRFNGNEFVAGNLQGEPGRSLSVNWRTGQWGDFATGDKGGDLISLYAAMQGVSQAVAARQLAGDESIKRKPAAQVKRRQTKRSEQDAPAPPPPDAPRPRFRHGRFGEPTSVWEYRDAQGKLIHYIARYDPPREDKQIVPWSWMPKQRRWRCKHPSSPRPLYGLDLLASRPDDPVMLVEGEKAADAARDIAGNVYVVVSWPGGCKTVNHVDWSPLAGRKMLLWPDADKPGIQAMQQIAELLREKCPEIKTIDPDGKPKGWDAADAVADGWGWQQFRDWAKPRAAAQSEKQATPQVTPSTSRMEIWLGLGLDLTSSGVPLNNLNNAVLILEHHEPLKDAIWWDEFHGKIFTRWGTDEPREWSDADDIAMALYLQRECGITRMGVQTAHDAVVLVAKRHVRNEVRDWFNELEWDGEPRLRDLMPRGIGADDGDYEIRVGECWMISMAARVYEPGCKVDTMPVLEGGQGIGKSSSLAVLGGKWFTECHESVLSKDFYGVLQGNLIVEIAEMHSFGRAEIDRVKGVISCQVDRFRPPYGRNTIDHPRRSVFAGTTNKSDWNRDETGARRFWPIRCVCKPDLDWLRENRDQLFAEAVARFQDGESWWTVPEAQAQLEQEARRQHDTWEEIISEWLVGQGDQVTTSQVLQDALKIEPAKQGRLEQLRCTTVLGLLGWERTNARIDGRVRKVWVKTIARRRT